MKKIVNSLSLRCFLVMLVGLFAATNMALAQVHTITLNSNSGVLAPEDETIIRNEGDPFGHLPTPTRSGFTFAGWYSIPGQETTRVTYSTPYQYAVHNEMLHARWVKKTITITFMDYTGQHVIGTIPVSALGGSLMDIDAATFQGTTETTNTYLKINDDEFFAGYYTRINGEGERIYSGVNNNGYLHPAITHESEFTSNVTLYAFKTHVKHTTHGTIPIVQR